MKGLAVQEKVSVDHDPGSLPTECSVEQLAVCRHVAFFDDSLSNGERDQTRRLTAWLHTIQPMVVLHSTVGSHGEGFIKSSPLICFGADGVDEDPRGVLIIGELIHLQHDKGQGTSASQLVRS